MSRSVLLLSLCVIAVHGLHITSPEARFIRSPIACSLIGDQNRNINITGEGAWVEMSECQRAGFDTRRISGKIALMYNDEPPRSLPVVEGIVRCLEVAGALAVVHLEEQGWLPGYQVYFSNSQLTRSVTLSLVQINRKDMVHELDNKLNVTLRVTADHNDWIDLFDGAAFLIVLRIWIVGINIVGSAVALEATIAHIERLFLDRVSFDSATIKRTVQIMFLGSVLEFVSCCLRCIYFGMGPVYSTTRITFPNHIFMIYSNLLLDSLSTLVAISLFLRWGAFGMQRNCFKKHLDLVLVISGLVLFALVFPTGYVEAHFVSSFFSAVTGVMPAIMFLLVLLCCMAFLIAGFRFTRQLRASQSFERNQNINRALRKAVRWITLSGAFLVIEVVGFVMRPFTKYYGPAEHFYISALIFTGVSLAALSHAIAFRPISRNRRGVFARILVACVPLGRIFPGRFAERGSTKMDLQCTSDDEARPKHLPNTTLKELL